MTPHAMKVVDILVNIGFADTKSEARRLIKQGGVKVEGERVHDIDAILAAMPGVKTLIQVGKRRFMRVTLVEKMGGE